MADILINVLANVSQATSALGQLGGKVAGIGSLGVGLTAGLTLPIVAFGGSALKTAADFEQAMSNVKSVADKSTPKAVFEQLQAAALKAGADTKYSAVEAAQGIEELMKAGVSTADILAGNGAGLNAALNLATAGEVSVGDAAKIASTAINGFKKDNMSLADAANIMAGAANASASDVGELQRGFVDVGPVASAAGQSFKDTAAALALFSQHALPGSQGGTSLKVMFMNLIPKTKEQKKAFEELGLATKNGLGAFVNADGSFKKMSEIAGILKEKFGGLSEARRADALNTIFGSDAARAANILIDEGAEGLDNMKKSIDGIKASDTAATKMDNLKGAIEQFKGSLETAQITLMLQFLPGLTEWVNKITALANKFQGLNPQLRQHILIIAGVAAAIGPLLLIVASLINAFMTVSGAVTALGGFLAGLSAPILVIIAVVAALVASFLYLWNTNESFRVYMIATWEAIKTSLSNIWNSIKEIAAVVIQILTQAWQKYGDDITLILRQAWTIIADVFRMAFQVIDAIFQIFAGIFTGNWNKVWEGVQRLTDVACKLIVYLLQQGFQLLVAIATTSGKILWDVIKKLWDAITTTIKEAWDHISTVVKEKMESVRAENQAKWEAVKTAIENVWNNIKTAVENGLNSVKTAIENKAESIKSAITKPFTSAADKVQGVISNIKSWWDGLSLSNKSVNVSATTAAGAGVVSGHALGGVVTKQSTSWLAEGNKPEGVVPLTRSREMAIIGQAIGAYVPKNGGDGSGGDTTVINLSFEGATFTNKELAKEVAEEVSVIIKKNMDKKDRGRGR